MKRNKNRKLTTPQSANSYVKSICDIMRRSGRAGALQYVPELTWMLFLRILPIRKSQEDTRTPEDLIAIIEEQQAEIAKAIAKLKEEGI